MYSGRSSPNLQRNVRRCLQGQSVSNSFAHGLLVFLEDGVVRYFEMSVNIYWTARSHISEDSNVISKVIPEHN
jgi:hypothetical protein